MKGSKGMKISSICKFQCQTWHIRNKNVLFFHEINHFVKRLHSQGQSDFAVILVLCSDFVITLCWWLLMLIVQRCWWQNHNVGVLFQCQELVTKISVTKIHHQHLKVVTNISRLQHPPSTSIKQSLLQWVVGNDQPRTVVNGRPLWTVDDVNSEVTEKN